MKLKSVVDTFKEMVEVKGKKKIDIVENYSILGLIGSAFLLSLGIGLSGLISKGFPVILAMGGALLSFLFTIVLIFVWLIKELR